MVYILLPIIISFVSTALMTYVAMAGEISDWGSSLVAVLAMLFVSHFFTNLFSRESVIGGIAAGSMGGMIGVCMGATWPSLYFLHKQQFIEWTHHPVFFAGIISLIVVVAGLLGFLVVRVLRYHIIVERKLKFPLSVLMYDMLDVKHRAHRIQKTMYGIGTLVGYHGFINVIKMISIHTSYILHAPIFISLGFISSFEIVKPMIIGVCVRLVSLYVVRPYFMVPIPTHEFNVTLGIGMFFGMIVWLAVWFIKKIIAGRYHDVLPDFSKLQKYTFTNRWQALFVGLFFIGVSFLLHITHMPFLEQVYFVVALLLLSNLVVVLFGKMGESGITTFVNFALLPLSYIFASAPSKLLYMATFGIVCLGIIINLFFSDKLARLAKISYTKIFHYQLIGFLVGTITVGCIMWWYIHVFKLGSIYLPASEALKEEVLLGHSHNNYYILLLGFILSFVLRYADVGVSLVVASLIMPFSQIGWLMVGGVISYIVKKDDQYYPYCFGIYAGHTLYIMTRAMLMI